MSEKLYALLLKLYPDNFRRMYGDEALRLVQDRAHSETGFLASFRLWLDLLLDLAKSLPREYTCASTTRSLVPQHLNGERSFQLLPERPLSRSLLCLSGMLSAVLFWACVFVAAHSGGFPALIPFSLFPQAYSDAAPDRDLDEESGAANPASNLAIGDSPAPPASLGAYSFCMTAKRDIPSSSVQPLFTFDFVRPGASGIATIDGKVVKVFKNEQRLAVRAHVLAGDHQFTLRLDRPAKSAFMPGNADFEYCRPK
ncbi:MAG: hypothetical protein LAP40_24110 [Acidobacteriia bacterium]|nr:hypothetical protein [Terriglobia bacterium]